VTVKLGHELEILMLATSLRRYHCAPLGQTDDMGDPPPLRSMTRYWT